MNRVIKLLVVELISKQKETKYIINRNKQPVEEINKLQGFGINHQYRKFKNLNFSLQIKHKEKVELLRLGLLQDKTLCIELWKTMIERL